MDNKWQCQLNPIPKTITVGQKLNLFCKGGKAVLFKQPLSIQWAGEAQPYSLYILKTVKQEENLLILEVTSYRPGLFNTPFFITDGEQQVFVNNLSFSVQSVLPQKNQPPSPQGSFGPFRDPLPLWYWLSLSLSFLFLSLCLFLFIRRLWKRKVFVQKIKARKTYINPSKSFIQGLRKQKEDSPDYLQHIEELFQKFLEDLFFIPARAIDIKKFMKNLKRQHAQIYKKEGKSIRQVLKEFSALKEKSPHKQSLKKLKKLCQDIVFRLDTKKGKK